VTVTRQDERGDEAAAFAVGEGEGAAMAFGVGDGQAEAGAAGRAAARFLAVE
jgi:hypothetical protein